MYFYQNFLKLFPNVKQIQWIVFLLAGLISLVINVQAEEVCKTYGGTFTGGYFDICYDNVDELSTPSTNNNNSDISPVEDSESEPPQDNESNILPVANFTFSTSQINGEVVVSLDASSSTDTDGSIVSYNWSTDGKKASGKNASFIFDQEGEYTIILTVEDDDLLESSVKKTVIVEPIITSDIQVLDITSKYSDDAHYLNGVDHEVTFTAKIDWGGHEPGEITYETTIGHGIKNVYATDEIFEKTFNIGRDFGVCGKLKVIAKSADGKQSEAKEAGFTVMSPPTNDNFIRVNDNAGGFTYSIGIGSVGPQFKLIDYLSKKANIDFPILGKNAVGLKLIPTIVPSVTSKGEATIKMDWSGKELASIEDTTNKNNVMKIGKVGFDVKPIVEATATFKNCEWKWGGKIGGSGKGEKSFTQQLPSMGPIPIPWYLKATMGLSLDGSLIIEKINPLEFNGGEIGLNVYGKGSVGVGLNDILAGEGWFNPGGGWKWKVPPLQITEPSSAVVYAKVGAKVVVFIFQWEGEALNCEWDFVKNNGKCSSPFIRSGNSSIPTLLSRDYLNQSSYSRLRRSTIRDGEPAPVQTTVFPYSEADISTTGNNLYATWLSDNPDRSAVNRTMAIFSIWNGTEWSELQPIDDDGTADFHPKMLAFSDETAIATWEDTKQTLSDTAQFEDMVQNMEISVSNYESQKWSGTQRLTDNDYLDRSPKLSGKDNTAIVTWISNETNNLLGDSANPNQLWYSQWLNNTWSTPQLVTEIPYPLIKYNTIYDGQNGYVVLSLDTDNDLQTMDDRELFTIALNNNVWDDSINQLTTDTNVDDNPQLGIDSNGQFILTWLKGGEISSIVNFDMSTKIILKTDENGYSSNLADFELATSADGKLAMVWAEPSKENSSDLYAVFYDSVANIWGSSKQLTSDQETEQRITASFYGSDTLIAIYNRKQIGEVKESIENNINAPVAIDNTDIYMVNYSIQTSDYTTIDNSFNYPMIKSVLSLDNNGSFDDSTAKFYGGISVNNGNFDLENNTIKKLNDTITVNGVIIPEAEHVGKKADIIVVGLYNSDPDYGKCEYEKDKGGYYMNRNDENEYCNWIVKGEESEKVCNPNPTLRSRSLDSYWQDWNGSLNNLVPLYTMTLSEQEILTADEGKVLYRDKPDYTGYVCLNFGYRVHDASCGEDETNCCMQPDKNCPIVFNGETINFSVRE